MNYSQEYAALILRITLGIMFVAHGLLKIMLLTLPGEDGCFEAVGFPGWMAYVVAYAEVGGGLLLISGFAVRAVSIALIPILLGATYVHLGAGWVFSNEGGGWEYPAFLTVATIVQALLGPGKFALQLPAKQPQTSAASL